MDKAHLKQLKSAAQHLKPVVILGQNGLSETVLEEIDHALTDHEHIKIRINAADHTDRGEIMQRICVESKSELVMHIGHVATFYRKSDKT